LVWVALLSLLIQACATNRPYEPVNEHEREVCGVLSDLWSPDFELESRGCERATKVLDDRIAASLIAKMYEDGAVYLPEHPRAHQLVEALRAQGYTVSLGQNGYEIKDTKYNIGYFVAFRSENQFVPK
jgi:hypothetical protein